MTSSNRSPPLPPRPPRPPPDAAEAKRQAQAAIRKARATSLAYVRGLTR